MRIYGTSDAIMSLVPGASFEMLHDQYVNLVWKSPDLPIPSEEEVNAERERLNQLEVARQYQYDRVSAYPSFAEQFDILFHQGYDGWKAVIQSVKDTYPKK